jgi:hypothetical protein
VSSAKAIKAAGTCTLPSRVRSVSRSCSSSPSGPSSPGSYLQCRSPTPSSRILERVSCNAPWKPNLNMSGPAASPCRMPFLWSMLTISPALSRSCATAVVDSCVRQYLARAASGCSSSSTNLHSAPCPRVGNASRTSNATLRSPRPPRLVSHCTLHFITLRSVVDLCARKPNCGTSSSTTCSRASIFCLATPANSFAIAGCRWISRTDFAPCLPLRLEICTTDAVFISSGGAAVLHQSRSSRSILSRKPVCASSHNTSELAEPLGTTFPHFIWCRIHIISGSVISPVTGGGCVWRGVCGVCRCC